MITNIQLNNYQKILKMTVKYQKGNRNLMQFKPLKKYIEYEELKELEYTTPRGLKNKKY